jgi:hypothetical protein
MKPAFVLYSPSRQRRFEAYLLNPKEVFPNFYNGKACVVGKTASLIVRDVDDESGELTTGEYDLNCDFWARVPKLLALGWTMEVPS